MHVYYVFISGFHTEGGGTGIPPPRKLENLYSFRLQTRYGSTPTPQQILYETLYVDVHVPILMQVYLFFYCHCNLKHGSFSSVFPLHTVHTYTHMPYTMYMWLGITLRVFTYPDYMMILGGTGAG